MGIDLHIHSTASDGTLTPAELLSRAQALGLQAIAITDHDSVTGSREALSLGIPSGLEFVTGVEISASPPRFLDTPGSFHILGYAFAPGDPELGRALTRLQAARKNRNPRILDRLKRLGIDVTIEDVRAVGGDAQLGRPHIARVLVEKGCAASVDQAFDRYLGTGMPAYVEKERIACAEAIDIIRGAGGLPVLAHPALLNLTSPRALEDLVAGLKQMGLAGIEAFYPDHTPADTARFAELAGRYGLIMTGGTDFHGDIKPEIEMGSGRGDFCVPYECYQQMMKHARIG